MPLPKIEIPKYEVKIPSTGKTIQYRPYLVKEEKILMIALETKSNRQIMSAMKDIVSVCTFNKIDPDKLCMFDLEYLFLKLRSKSTGEISRVGLKCSHCEVSNKVEINLDEVSVKFPEKVEKKIQLNDEIGVTLCYPKTDFLSEQDGKLTAAAITDVVIACIDTIYDGTKVYHSADSTKEELIEFVDSLNQAQFLKIQEFISNMPKLELNVKFKCDKCKKENELTITGLQNFFN